MIWIVRFRIKRSFFWRKGVQEDFFPALIHLGQQYVELLFIQDDMLWYEDDTPRVVAKKDMTWPSWGMFALKYNNPTNADIREIWQKLDKDCNLSQ